MTPYLSYSACPFTDVPFPTRSPFSIRYGDVCIPLKAAVFRTFKRCDASLQKVYVSDQMISDISLCFLISLPFKIYFRNKTVT